MKDDPNKLSVLISLLSEDSKESPGVDVKTVGREKEVKLQAFGKVFYFKVPGHIKHIQLLTDFEGSTLKLIHHGEIFQPYKITELQG